MRSSCHFVPALVCALALPGCLLSHQNETEPGFCGRPAGMVCCRDGVSVGSDPTPCPFECPAGTRLVRDLDCVGIVIDGGMPPPPPPPPPPPACPLVRAHVACLAEDLVVAPGVPFELPLTYDQCGCCIETACAVEADDATRTLRLGTTLCPDPCDCDTCVVPTVTCSVPGLRRGSWRVIANGSDAFTLRVGGAVEPAAAGACATFADENDCEPGERLDLHEVRPETVCAEPHAFLPLHHLRLSWSCPDCREINGPCVVRYEERFTDDLPPGGELHLAPPTAHTADCRADCPPACFERMEECITPDLLPGNFYRVWYEDRPILSFTAGDGSASCTTL